MGVVAAAAGCEAVIGLNDARRAAPTAEEAGARTVPDASLDAGTGPVADADADAASASPDLDSRYVVASLGNHTCAVGPDGYAYCWGDNSEGQLGDGTIEQRDHPVRVGDIDHVIDVSAGYTHSCLVRDNGDVYCWGKNDRGQLGDGTKENRHTPVLAMSGATHVGVAGWHTCALTKLQGVRCWGDNYYGALGDGTFNASTSYVDVRNLSNVTSLGVGVMHNCATTSQGKVYCWGRAVFGEVGYAVDGGNGSPDPNDYGSPNVGQVLGVSDADEVVSGEDHSCAIQGTNGHIMCWGRNDYAEYGDGTKDGFITPEQTLDVTYPKHIAAGKFTTCGIFSGGIVRCWGENNFGQLGNGDTIPGPYTPSPKVAGLSDVRRLSTNDHTCAWKTGFRLYCWGRNDKGQLGIGKVSDYELTPQEVIFPSTPQSGP